MVNGIVQSTSLVTFHPLLIIIVVIAASLVFVLASGRLIGITTAVKVRRTVFLFYRRLQKFIDVVNQHQEEAYEEIAIGGDSSLTCS